MPEEDKKPIKKDNKDDTALQEHEATTDEKSCFDAVLQLLQIVGSGFQLFFIIGVYIIIFQGIFHACFHKPDQDSYATHLQDGILKMKRGDQQGAILDFDMAIEKNPDQADLYIHRATAKGILGNHQGAIDDYTKAIEIYPNYPGYYNDRRILKELKGDLEGACADWKQAVDRGLLTDLRFSGLNLSSDSMKGRCQ